MVRNNGETHDMTISWMTYIVKHSIENHPSFIDKVEWHGDYWFIYYTRECGREICKPFLLHYQTWNQSCGKKYN